MTEISTPSSLDPRFLPPEGWRWHVFERNGHRLRFGTVSPPGGRPDIVVIGLQGLSEFSEKYFEFAHDCVKRNYSFWIMDWRGQGGSAPYFPDRKKRHAQDFADDVADLHHFIKEYVLHSSVTESHVDRLPLAMLAHSMGANLGLRYLHDHPGIFACAVMTAPMAGIHRLRQYPRWVRKMLTGLFGFVAGRAYVFGGKAWRPLADKGPGAVLSTDPVRGHVADQWCVDNPSLRVGDVTFGWLYQAVKSCAIIKNRKFLKSVSLPVFIAVAGDDDIVDNDAARCVAEALPHCVLVDYPGARHEILMESDPIRNDFLNAFDRLISDNGIKSKLSPL